MENSEGEVAAKLVKAKGSTLHSGAKEDGNEWVLRTVLGRTAHYVVEPYMAVLN